MKKRSVNVLLGVILTAALAAGCGKQAEPAAPAVPEAAEQTQETAAEPAAEEPAAEEAPEEEENLVGMANPWVDITAEEANELVLRLFKVPEGAKDLGWMKCEDLGDPAKGIGPLVQLSFEMDGMYFTARAQQGAAEDTDIAGNYVEWTVGPEEVTLANWGGGNMKGKMYRSINDTGMLDQITWYDVEIGISYSLSVAATDLEGFDIQAVAEQMYAEEAEPFGFGPTDFVQYQSGRMEFKDYDDVISCLKSGQGYTKIKLVGSDDEILALAEEPGADASSKEVLLYTMKDGAPYQLGYVMGQGNPVRYGNGVLYGGNEQEYQASFLTPDGAGIMMKASVTEDTSSGTASYTGFLRDKNDFDSTQDFTGGKEEFDALLKEMNSQPVLTFTIV